VLDALLHVVDRIGAALVISTHDPLIAERLPARWRMADGVLLDDVRAAGGLR
jgi:predicted ABC-type transport system involved in lysophospholipase L1 biosynthesis ATPase subunit